MHSFYYYTAFCFYFQSVTGEKLEFNDELNISILYSYTYWCFHKWEWQIKQNLMYDTQRCDWLSKAWPYLGRITQMRNWAYSKTPPCYCIFVFSIIYKNDSIKVHAFYVIKDFYVHCCKMCSIIIIVPNVNTEPYKCKRSHYKLTLC